MGVVEGRVIGGGSGVDSRTTKSRLGHGRRPQHGDGAQPTSRPRQVFVVWEFGWGKTMGSRLDGRGPGNRSSGGSTAAGSSTRRDTAPPSPRAKWWGVLFKWPWGPFHVAATRHGHRLQHGRRGAQPTARRRQVFRGLGVRVGQGRWAPGSMSGDDEIGRRGHGRRRAHGHADWPDIAGRRRPVIDGVGHSRSTTRRHQRVVCGRGRVSPLPANNPLEKALW